MDEPNENDVHTKLLDKENLEETKQVSSNEETQARSKQSSESIG